MGWFGYGIYDGDETSSLQEWMLNKCGLKKIKEDFHSEYLKDRLNDEQIKIIKTRAFQNKLLSFVLNDNKKSPWGADITSQMLLALFVDLKIKPLKAIYNLGRSATLNLMGKHADDFNQPSKRKHVLKMFLDQADKLMNINKSLDIKTEKRLINDINSLLGQISLQQKTKVYKSLEKMVNAK